MTTPTIERGRTRITIPARDVVFTHPFEGPNSYQEVGNRILQDQTANLGLPTAEKTAYFLQEVYNGPEQFQNEAEPAELRNIMKQRHLWIFNRNLWVGGENPGVYIQHDPQALGNSQTLNVCDLEESLRGGTEVEGVKFSQDGRTAFASRETYKEGEFTPEEFAKDGFVLASFGKMGTEKIAEVSQSDHFRYKNPKSWIIDPSDEPVQTLSAVGGDNGRLGLCGLYHVGDRSGYASGVFS